MAGEWVDDTVEVPIAVPVPVPVPVSISTSKLYIDKLHADTNSDDLVMLLTPLTAGVIQRPFVSKSRNGYRWAKFDIDDCLAEDLNREVQLRDGCHSCTEPL